MELLMLFAWIAFIVFYPGWHQKRLIRKAINAAIVNNRLDAGSIDEITKILGTGKHCDVVNWMRQNEDKFPGELLAITKKTVMMRKSIVSVFVGCCVLLAIYSTVMLGVHFGRKAVEIKLVVWAVILIISLLLLIVQAPQLYVNYLVKKVLNGATVQQDGLDDGLRNEARAILDARDYGYGFAWIKHNQAQLSGELSEMAQKAIKTNGIANVYIFSLIAIAVALAVIFSE